MAEAAKKLEAEVIVRPGTPKRRVSAPRIVPFQSKVVAIDEDTTSPQDANKNVESRKDPELYKPEDLAVKRDRYRLRMRGRGSGRRGGITRAASQAAQRAGSDGTKVPTETGEPCDLQEHPRCNFAVLKWRMLRPGGEEKVEQKSGTEAGVQDEAREDVKVEEEVLGQDAAPEAVEGKSVEQGDEQSKPLEESAAAAAKVCLHLCRQWYPLWWTG